MENTTKNFLFISPLGCKKETNLVKIDTNRQTFLKLSYPLGQKKKIDTFFNIINIDGKKKNIENIIDFPTFESLNKTEEYKKRS
ncbi:hypothetical protein [Lacinutrix mariniflava]|uniref:hypothetical protein n=1 Tax=Lacinutrix mariniflava TaxID=342955 RepID=UPI000A822FBD|nr:hypothetical protein [Lacinutrix mariniflava]